VRELAAALDRDDFGAAALFLAEDCEYHVRGEVTRGRAAILASYRASSEWGRAHLDGVVYESEVEAPRGAEVGVRFSDHLTAGDRRFTHRCRQVFTVSDQGLVIRIEHHDLPGEPEALKAFFDSCGIARD